MVSIQPVRPEQAEELTLLALSAKAYWGYPRHWMEIWQPQLTFDPDYFIQNESWAAVEGEAPVGFYTLREKDGNAWLEDLWVLPGYIGRGIGKALFLHAVGLSRRRGYKTLQLEADPHAVGFYEKMGMRRIRERQYQIEGLPRSLPVMQLDL